MSSFYQHIYDVNDIAAAIETLIKIEIERAEEESDKDYNEQLEAIQEELDEARETIEILRTMLDERDAEIERILAKEGC